MAPNSIIRGSLETDSWEKPEVENYRVRLLNISSIGEL